MATPKYNKEKLTGEEKEEFLSLMRKRYKNGFPDETNRKLATEDVEFCNGKQWDEQLERERIAKRRPCLTFNLLDSFIKQVAGEQRQNKPKPKVRTANDKANPQTAKIIAGLVREILYKSRAETVLTSAFESALRGGFGFCRLVNEYESEDSFNQVLRLKQIPNPFSVVLDPSGIDANFIDAKWGFIIKTMDREEFNEKYPDVSISSFEGLEGQEYEGWYIEGDKVLIAEYFIVEEEKVNIVMLSDGRTMKEVEWKEEIKELSKKPQISDIATGIPMPPQPLPTIKKTREIQEKKICQYLVCGHEILDGPNDWVGTYCIPIFPVLGDEINIKGQKIFRSLIRYAKDAQKMFNYFRSTSTETVALSPKAHYIGTVKQFEGHEKLWDESNVNAQVRLVYNPDTEAPGPPQKLPAADPPIALFQEAQNAQNNMMSIIGLYAGNLGMPTDRSAKAIMADRQQGNTGTYIFMDNYLQSLTHIGNAIVDALPNVYDGERDIVIIQDNEMEELASINKVAIQGNEPVMVNDLKAGKYSVVMDVGPSYATERTEAAQGMNMVLQTNPEMMKIMGDLYFKELDINHANEISERLRKMLPPGLAEPRPGDPPPAPPQPDPQAMIEAKRLENEMFAKQVELQKSVNELQGKMADLQHKGENLKETIRRITIETMREAHS